MLPNLIYVAYKIRCGLAISQSPYSAFFSVAL